ncbi:CTP synthase [Candidatus Dojkabacteria bacterium]|jgi:CTP synthase|nr:CTP synthase [Candidatus Dojkabacteria bacterium]
MKKYIFVSGGVISGLGKGIASSSIGVLLKSYGLKITMIKADPYLNVDAGTMNPLEHGETFVLEDGFETDMDIGTYERFTGELFSRANSMTSGAVFEKVIKDERSLAYEGKWVSIDYHVPLGMIDWIEKVSNDTKAEVTIIEIGGTVGEIGNKLFLEANRIMKVNNPSDVIHIHLSYLPVPGNIGEMKSKPVQLSVKELISSGISPEILLARSEGGVDDIRKEKLSMYCTVKPGNIFSAPDVDNIYKVVTNFYNEGLGEVLIKELGIDGKRKQNIGYINKWKDKIKQIDSTKTEVHVGIVAKYFKSGGFNLKDSYASVIEAINHSAWSCGVKPVLHWIVSDGLEDDKKRQNELLKYDGIIVPQGWGSRGVEGKIKVVEIVRKKKIPYLGLCFGMQMAVIEYARNVLGLKDASSQEVNEQSKNQVINLMEDQKENLSHKKFGGTIRLGAYPCKVIKGSLLEEMYKENKSELFKNLPIVSERHRHRYEFNNKYREILEKNGLHISGISPDNTLVEAIELDRKVHPFFIGTQYHPELKSHFINPHPIFLGFIKACMR